MSTGKWQTCCFSFHAKDAASQHSLLAALPAITPVLSFPEATILCFLTIETLCFYMKIFNSYLVINTYKFRQMPHLSGRKGCWFENSGVCGIQNTSPRLPCLLVSSFPWSHWSCHWGSLQLQDTYVRLKSKIRGVCGYTVGLGSVQCTSRHQNSSTLPRVLLLTYKKF